MASLQALDLGGITVQVLRDAQGSFTTFDEAFPNSSGEIEAVGRDRYFDLFDGDRWLLPFCAFLIRSRAQTVLVDAGVGPGPRPGEFLPERQGWLPAELSRAGVAPEDVDLVILTHLHVDHIGWAVVDGRPFFARARYAVTEVDWRFFADRGDETFAAKLAPLERAGVLALVELERAEVAPGVALRPTPGHTPGHISLEIGGETHRAFVLGDVAVHPLQLHDPRLAYVYEESAAVAAETRESVLRDIANTDAVVAAGHFPGGLGQISARHRGFDWQAISS